VTDKACNACEVATIRFGAGIARAFWDERFALFAIADARVEAGHELDGIEGEAIRAGFGPAGASARLSIRSFIWSGKEPGSGTPSNGRERRGAQTPCFVSRRHDTAA
jgi:hypothetical protein